jgi:hypothetical protein
MDVGAAFVANTETAELMEPGNRAFDDPASFTQSTAMFGVSTSQLGSHAATAKFVAVRLRIVTAIALDEPGPMAWPTGFAADRRNSFHQGQKLGYVVCIRAGKRRGQGNARRIRNDMVLAPRFAPIGRIWPGFCPPSTARTLELSTTVRDQSIRSVALSSASSSLCRRFQIPAACQSRNRRQQVIPQPQPSSCGNIAQGMPLRSTNKIPVNARRLPSGGRPPLVDSVSGGKSGSTRFHSSSDTSDLAMTILLDRSSAKQTTSR